MKFLLSICLIALAAPVFADIPAVNDIVKRARATVGAEAALDGLVTLSISGRIEPSGSKLPEATILIIARKPCSQRLAVKVDDLVETTILRGKEGCIIRSNVNEDASQMRKLSDVELERVIFSTRQFFNFYRPDFKGGERITYEGIEQRRGVRCHKLVYKYESGLSTTRYFAVNNDALVSTITDVGLESVSIGEQIINGIKFPIKVEYYEKNEMLHTIVLTEILTNKPLEERIFEIPQGQPQK
jgi:hypothetical protein